MIADACFSREGDRARRATGADVKSPRRLWWRATRAMREVVERPSARGNEPKDSLESVERGPDPRFLEVWAIPARLHPANYRVIPDPRMPGR